MSMLLDMAKIDWFQQTYYFIFVDALILSDLKLVENWIGEDGK